MVRKSNFARNSCEEHYATKSTLGWALMDAYLIGVRLKALRAEKGLSQNDLAQLFGFKDRQTVSAIETGTRRMTATELMLAVEKLGAPLEYFTDPFQLVGEGRFSWRHTGVRVDQLKEYERAAGRWIAAYRALAPQVGRDLPLMRRALGLTRNSRLKDAMVAGERFVAEFNLGELPATALIEVMERELGILVLMVDAQQRICGAACRLPELDTVIVQRRAVEGRRNFVLAHELFHILTWDAMPPKRSEEIRETGGNRVEQLANNFVAAVLMPASTLEQTGGWASLAGEDLIAQLNAVADKLRVTSSALRWRLASLGELKPAVARALPEDALLNNGHKVVNGATPALFSRRFFEILALAIETGYVSVSRIADLLGLAIEDLADLFATNGVAQPVEL